jgi:hypothetical protein
MAAGLVFVLPSSMGKDHASPDHRRSPMEKPASDRRNSSQGPLSQMRSAAVAQRVRGLVGWLQQAPAKALLPRPAQQV